jgi:hypothetical protein
MYYHHNHHKSCHVNPSPALSISPSRTHIYDLWCIYTCTNTKAEGSNTQIPCTMPIHMLLLPGGHDLPQPSLPAPMTNSSPCPTTYWDFTSHLAFLSNLEESFVAPHVRSQHRPWLLIAIVQHVFVKGCQIQLEQTILLNTRQKINHKWVENLYLSPTKMEKRGTKYDQKKQVTLTGSLQVAFD